MAICIVARVIGTLGMTYLINFIQCKKPDIPFKQLCFCCYAGLIRGAIAFGLVLKLDDTLIRPQYLPVIKTTALTLVISTTLIFGSTMQIVQTLLVPPLNEKQITKELGII